MKHSYKNGNYSVTIDDETGTHIRDNGVTDPNDPNYAVFDAEFPENIDLKVSDRCGMNCPMCHENSTPDGDLAILDPLPVFIDTLKPYTELAIGGGSIFEHPDLEYFLTELKKRKVIANITISQKDYEDNVEKLMTWTANKLVYGIGVSLTDPSSKFIKSVQQFRNTVIHVINGVVCGEQIVKLSKHGLKLLILGYKEFGRGVDYYEKNKGFTDCRKDWLKRNIEKIIKENWFKVVSFDNLAIEQLGIKDWMPKEDWDKFYRGDDGQHTLYVDLCDMKYGKNSTSYKTDRFTVTRDIVEMFQYIKHLSKEGH